MSEQTEKPKWNRWDATKYNEDTELTDYIWHNYRNLLTDFEWKVFRAWNVEWKADRADNPSYAAAVRKRFGSRDDPRVVEILNRGFEVFARAARERILSEHSDQIDLNRCGRCQRIVATPTARQCLWCGNDWHAQQ